MKYCSKCGAGTIRRWVASDERHRWICTQCSTTHYENPRVIVRCVVSWRNEILFCCRSQHPARGQWTVPSGFLECGETLQEGAARETFEETGVLLDPARLILCSVMNLAAIDQIVITFRAAFDERPVTAAGEECLDAKFMSEQEIAGVRVAWASAMGDSPRRFFEQLRSGSYPIELITVEVDGGRDPDIDAHHVCPAAPVKTCV